MQTLCVIHHSHTDVGYTAQQSTIAGWHGDFSRQALDAIDPRRRGPGAACRWTCETFWSVEQFLGCASGAEIDRFAQAVRCGAIGLSGSHLDFNELSGEELLQCVTARAAAYGRSTGNSVRTARATGVRPATVRRRT